MSIRMEDLGEIGYGGVVTLADWWDNKRIADGKLAADEWMKKSALWTYLVIGLVTTLASAFNWMPNFKTWEEHISHGFLYDVPRFVTNMVKSMATPAGAHGGAVVEAQRILAQRQRALASGSANAQAEARARAQAEARETHYEVVGPNEILV